MSEPGRAPVTARDIEQLLQTHGFAPLHRLGQNLLIRTDLLDRIVALADVGPGDPVLEVGPGLGGLTERLLLAGASVLAVELDRGFANLLPKTLGEFDGLDLIEGDILANKGAWNAGVVERLERFGAPFTVASNLPYQISSPFLMGLLSGSVPPWRRAVVMLQREVAQVLAAGPGDAAYSPLSFASRLGFELERGPRLSAACFHPQPRVESQVVVLKPRSGASVASVLPFARQLFQTRRKVLATSVRKVLAAMGHATDREQVEAAFAAVGLSTNDRIDGVDPEQVAVLWDRLRPGDA